MADYKIISLESMRGNAKQYAHWKDEIFQYILGHEVHTSEEFLRGMHHVIGNADYDTLLILNKVSGQDILVGLCVIKNTSEEKSILFLHCIVAIIKRTEYLEAMLLHAIQVLGTNNPKVFVCEEFWNDIYSFVENHDWYVSRFIGRAFPRTLVVN